MGKGFINQNSKIRIRMMTRKPDQEINEAFLKMRVKNAWEYRKTTVDTSSCRIIFGEADFLPGLVIDKYEDVLVVECLALGMEQFKEIIVNFLKEILAEDGIKIRGVYERSDANERTKEGLSKVKGFIGDAFDTNVEIVENGVHYMVDVANGQENRIFPRPEIQSSCHAAYLQRQESFRLFYTHGNICAERRNRRGSRCHRT